MSLTKTPLKVIGVKGGRKLDVLNDAIDIWAEETPTIIEQLKDSISDLEYISLISKYGHPMKVPHDALELASLTALYENRDEEVEIEFSCLIWHVFSMKSTSLESSFGSNAYDGFDWGRDGSVNWIKTNNIFITVVGKNTESTELPAKLLEALTHWHPHPHKLLLAKLRHQMDEQGFSIANMVVSKRYVQASWLKELLSANPRNDTNASLE